MTTWQSFLLKWVLKIITAFPEHFWYYLVVPPLAKILWFSKAKRNIATNVALCYPDWSEQERQELVKANIKHTLYTVFEFCYVLMRPAERSLKQIVRIEGETYVNEALAAGKALLFLSPHLGNWEYLGLQVGKDYPTTSLFKPGRIDALNILLHQARERSGGKLVPTNKKGVLQVLRALKKRQASGILPDQIPDKNSGAVFAPFFKEPVATMTLINSLLRKTDTVAIACYAKRLKPGKFCIVYQPAEPAVDDEDVLKAATALNKTVEALINQSPEQYQWIYKRFREGPEGKRRIYR